MTINPSYEERIECLKKLRKVVRSGLPISNKIISSKLAVYFKFNINRKH